VIRWYYVPWGVGGAAFADCVLVRFLVLRPVFTLRIIRFANFPMAAGIVEALLEPVQLLFLIDVKVELQNLYAFVR